MKLWKKLLLVVFTSLAGIVICVLGWYLYRVDQENNKWHTDWSGISSRFPLIHTVKQCWWKREQPPFTGLVGPIDEEYLGYIVLIPSDIAMIASRYTWVSMPPNEVENCYLDDLPQELRHLKTQWYKCAITPDYDTVDFLRHGDIEFDKAHGIIHFRYF